MKIFKQLIIFLFCFLLLSRPGYSETMIIGHYEGLFASFLRVLNCIAWCEKNETIPAVYWGSRCIYYQNEGHNGVTGNVWEYYFEPISSIKVTKEEAIMPERKKLNKKFLRTFSPSLKIPTPFEKDYSRILDCDFRNNYHDIIAKYIKIKPSIIEKIDEFYYKNMNEGNVIGIHLRGTDKELEVKSVATPETICEEANRVAAEMGGGIAFFVATDEESLLQTANRMLNGPVISYPSYRSLNGAPIHLDNHSYSKALLGEEVLIEMVLLSKCQYFIHTRSNVSSSVLLFNPELKNTVLY